MKKDFVCKSILEGNDATALTIALATKKLLGDGFWDWEPETIRIELKERDVEPRDENFDALMAVMTLREQPSFYYDGNVFENVCAALSNHPVQFDILQELCVANIAWAVQQAHLIVDTMATYDIPDKEELPVDERFDYEPIAYTAAVGLHTGMVTFPEELSFAREYMEEKSNASDKFISHVKKRWTEIKPKISETSFTESAVDIQLALMSTVPMYIHEQTQKLDAQKELLNND